MGFDGHREAAGQRGRDPVDQPFRLQPSCRLGVKLDAKAAVQRPVDLRREQPLKMLPNAASAR